MVSWQWLPFAALIFMTALQSMNREQIEAARMDGANYLQQLWLLPAAAPGRSVAVVVMIEMIFLLSVFAEIYTTTGGGPGDASTNVAFLIFKQALLNFDAGVASAGALFAVLLANIAAIFLIRLVGRTSTSEHRHVVTPNSLPPCCAHALLAWSVRCCYSSRSALCFLTAFKTGCRRSGCRRCWCSTLASFHQVQGAATTCQPRTRSSPACCPTLLRLAIHLPAPATSMARARPARHPDVDALDQMMPPSARWFRIYVLAQSTLLDTQLALVIIFTPSNSADHGLGCQLLAEIPGESPRGGAHGRRQPVAGIPPWCCCR